MTTIRIPRWAVLVPALALAAGCGDQRARYEHANDAATHVRIDGHIHPSEPHTFVTRAEPPPVTEPFAGVEHLTWELFFERLHTHSPRLAGRIATWQASVARYPQVTSLEDPTLAYSVAPRSIGRGSGNGNEVGQSISLTQPLPWPGRLRDRGETTLADADAQRALIDDEHRHHLVESRAMYAEYWLAGRTLALLGEVRAEIVREQRAADAAATAGGPALPAAEAALALATLDRRLLTARRELAEKTGALNAMLGRAADAALPPPVETLINPTPLPAIDTLKDWAHRLPVVRASEARVREAEARIAQARRDGSPELGISAGWSTMEERDNRFTVGVSTTLPVYRGRRDAAVDEAAATTRAARAALAAAIADSERDVLENRARLVEGEQAIALLRTAAIPAAERALAATRAAYGAGNGTLAELLRARRMLVESRLEEAVERHEYFHRRGYLMDIPPVTGAQP